MRTVATWNLHHMAAAKDIRTEVVDVIRHVDPDVLVLTEYVQSAKTKWFEDKLTELAYQAVSASPAGRNRDQNQVLIASKAEQHYGVVALQGPDEAANTNFLHRRIPELGLDLVGFRAPYYSTEPEKWRPYWDLLEQCADLLISRNTVLIGDFNWSTKKGPKEATEAIRRLIDRGYCLVNNGWGPTPANAAEIDPSEIDNALLSPSVECKSVIYRREVAGHNLCGPATGKPLSDHPMLLLSLMPCAMLPG